MKVIYNASAYKHEKDEKIRNFLHFISTNEPGEDDFSNRLSDLVEIIKDNEIFRSDYASMNLHDRDIMRMARKEGAQQKAVETAAKLLQKDKMSEAETKEFFNFTDDQMKLVKEKLLELNSQKDA